MEDIDGIDFVIPWVDNSDPSWQEAFALYTEGLDGDCRVCRYREWGTLRYLFRGFERFTPWVRKVHFVTWGHLPTWLNTSHEKLNIVRHEDFLESDNLPVFSSHAIEINFHKIPGLAERFVYFNDDMFLLKTVGMERFFKNGLARDVFALDVISDSPISHIKINDVQAINRHFSKTSNLKRNFFKIFNYRYGVREIIKTILLLPWPNIPGFYDHHQPQPFLKSTFLEVWEKEPEIMCKTAGNKVRNFNDINQYIFRYWQLCKGDFLPTSYRNYSNLLTTYEDAINFYQRIISGKYEMICINDNVADDAVFERSREAINNAFESILPDKSLFER